MLFKASAPGSLMLLGEYAVLHGKHALVCAVDKRITVTLSPRADDKISLTSALGVHETDIASLQITAPFQFVLAVLKKFKKKIHLGCDITIAAEFSAELGFASSAAVTVATLSAVLAWLQLSMTAKELVRLARSIVREVQGMGSGADVAACVYGGMVQYRAQPLHIEKLVSQYPLTVVYSGQKTPTVKAIHFVNHFFASCPQIFKQICQAIDVCVLQGVTAIKKQDWAELGKIMDIHQGLMDALGVNTRALQSIVYTLREQPKILGAKISGSGLGDCVVGLGQLANEIPNEQAVRIDDQGVLCEQV